jgi:hypothetical protein
MIARTFEEKMPKVSVRSKVRGLGGTADHFANS